jgi:hypothetical protein
MIIIIAVVVTFIIIIMLLLLMLSLQVLEEQVQKMFTALFVFLPSRCSLRTYTSTLSQTHTQTYICTHMQE